MFHNFFKTAFRNLWKNKSYSFLNIFGLAVGIACASLIFLWVENELSYDHYFKNRETLYKIKDRQTYSGQTYTFDATPGPLAPAIRAEIPGIKNSARYRHDQLLFSLEDKHINEQGGYVDSNFLSMFHLDFIKGNPGHAFDQMYSVIISEKAAKKFFEDANPIGKTLKVNNNQDYLVTGVFKDLPENVSLKFDWLAPFRLYEKDNPWVQTWGNNGLTTFVELQPKADTSSINKKLYNFVASKAGAGAIAKMSVYPMDRWRLYDHFDDGKEMPGRIKYVRLFSLIAWIILIIACINFMNLATARSEQRAREVGIRKALGALKGKLILQFITESLFLSLISTVLAVAIILIFLRGFNALVEEPLSLNLFHPLHLGALLLVSLICGLVAGSYPAFFLSSFRPVVVLKGLRLKAGNSAGLIRKGLVVTQFSVSIILIICTLLIYRQIQHVKNRDLGYNKEHLVYTTLQGKMQENFTVIKNDLLQTGMVKNATLSSQTVLLIQNNSGGMSWQGKDPNKQLLVSIDNVSPEFIRAMGLTIKEGRDFHPDAISDSSSVIINETLAKDMQLKQVLGSTVSWDKPYTIVGIVKDFLYNDMYKTPAPLVLFPKPQYAEYLSIRLKPGIDLSNALSKMEAVIKKDNPGYPVEFQFVDAQFNQLFKTETLIGKLAGLFAVLAILISCLGLFGLSAYTAERRTKEIGIRKVLGASVNGLAGLLSKDFIRLVIISCLIAFPASWWIMNKWLQGYDYRISIHWWIFLIAGGLAVFIALLTVSFQAIRAAVANPVESLRAE